MKSARLLFPLLLLLACKPQPPGTPGPIACGVTAVQTQWPRVLPEVNRCLTDIAVGDVSDCLLGLIDPGAGITESLVACLVKSSGDRFRDAADHNANDAMSARAATRAAVFLNSRGYKFQ